MDKCKKSIKKFLKSKTGKWVIGTICFVAYTVLIYFFAIDNYKAEVAIKSAERQTFMEHLAESDHFYEDEATLQEMMKDRTKSENTELLDLYFYYLGQYASDCFTSDDETYLLESKVEGQITSDAFNDDDEMKETMLDVEKSHILVKNIQDTIVTQIDYKYFIDTYKDNITQGYLDLLYLYDDEQSEFFYNLTSGDVYPDVVTKRMDMAYAGMTREGNEDVSSMMKSAYDYYLEIYLGVTDVELVNGKNGHILDEVLESYKNYQTEDNELRALLDEMVAKFTETDNMRTVEIAAMVNEFLGIDGETEVEGYDTVMENDPLSYSDPLVTTIQLETDSNASDSASVVESEAVTE